VQSLIAVGSGGPNWTRFRGGQTEDAVFCRLPIRISSSRLLVKSWAWSARWRCCWYSACSFGAAFVLRFWRRTALASAGARHCQRHRGGEALFNMSVVLRSCQQKGFRCRLFLTVDSSLVPTLAAVGILFEYLAALNRFDYFGSFGTQPLRAARRNRTSCVSPTRGEWSLRGWGKDDAGADRRRWNGRTHLSGNCGGQRNPAPRSEVGSEVRGHGARPGKQNWFRRQGLNFRSLTVQVLKCRRSRTRARTAGVAKKSGPGEECY